MWYLSTSSGGSQGYGSCRSAYDCVMENINFSNIRFNIANIPATSTTRVAKHFLQSRVSVCLNGDSPRFQSCNFGNLFPHLLLIPRSSVNLYTGPLEITQRLSVKDRHDERRLSANHYFGTYSWDRSPLTTPRTSSARMHSTFGVCTLRASLKTVRTVCACKLSQ